MLSTGAPQECVLSSLLYMTYICDCIQIHPTNMITEFAADTTVFGLISVSDVVGYKSKLKKKNLIAWSLEIALNILRTKELVVNF